MTGNWERSGGEPIVRMMCDRCGAAMNPHAEKPVVAVSEAEIDRMDPATGGRIEEIHQCPQCGRIEVRSVH